jgi:hypothetical protein
VVKQAHNVDSFREHPLDDVGCDRNEVNKDYHNLGNEYIRELRHLIDERTAALSEIQKSMRLPYWHPDALRLQRARGPNTNLTGFSRLCFRAVANMAAVELHISEHGHLHFPFKELDEIIGRLVVPAATTMQVLSKQGNHKEFQTYASCPRNLPLVRLCVRTLPTDYNHASNDADSDASDKEYMECIKLELVPPGDEAYKDDMEMEDIYGIYMVTAGYRLQARRGQPPNYRVHWCTDGLTSTTYCDAHVIAALIAHDPALLRALELFVQDCVHMHLEIWWRTAELATIKCTIDIS